MKGAHLSARFQAEKGAKEPRLSGFSLRSRENGAQASGGRHIPCVLTRSRAKWRRPPGRLPAPSENLQTGKNERQKTSAQSEN